MKRIWTILTCFTLGYSAYAQTFEESIQQSSSLLQSGDYNSAISILEIAEQKPDGQTIEAKCVISLYKIICYTAVGKYKSAINSYHILQDYMNELPIEYQIVVLQNIMAAYSETSEDPSVESNMIAKKLKNLFVSDAISTITKWEIASTLCAHYGSAKEYGDIITLGQKCEELSIDERSLTNADISILHVCKHTLYVSMGEAYLTKNDYNNALAYYENSIAYAPNEESESLSYAKISEIKAKQKNVDSSIANSLISLRKNDNKIDRLSLVQYINLGTQYFEANDIAKSNEYFLKAVDISKETNSEYLPYCYARLVNNYQLLGDKNNTNVYIQFLEESIDTYTDKTSKEYGICLNTIGYYKKDIGSFKEAKQWYKQALDVYKKLYGKHSVSLFSTLYNLYSIEHSLQNFPEAFAYVEQCISITEFQTNYVEEYVSALIAKSILLFDSGQIAKAFYLGENMYEFIDKLDKYSRSRVAYYNMFSHFYGELHDYDKAIEYQKKVIEFDKMRTGEKSPNYANSLLNLSILLAANGQTELALQYNKDALRLFESTNGTKSHEYYFALNRIASLYNDSCEKRAIKKECIELSKVLFGEMSVEYSDNLAFSAWDEYISSPQKGINCLKQAIDIRKSLGLDNDVKTIEFLSWLSTMYFATKQQEFALETDLILYEKIKVFVKTNLFSLNVSEREKLWSLLQPILSGISANNNTMSPTRNKLIYNCLILRKTLLLYSTNAINDAILKLNNQEALVLKKEISKDNEKLKSMPSGDERLQVIEGINYKKRQLLNKISSSELATEIVDIDWSNISNSLKYNEVAIEFFSYESHDCTNYVAAILQKNLAPQIIGLFNDKEIAHFLLEDNVYDYNNPEFYKVCWGILDKYVLGSKKTIYFSPDGVLNNIAIEYITDSNDIRANEKWNLYRLSSTRELLNTTAKDGNKNIVILYGGLNYTKKQIPEIDLTQRDNNLKRSGLSFDYLINTKEEVISIQKMFADRKHITKLYIGDDGKESSIFSIAGQYVSVLHFATHGFYWSKENSVDYGKYPFLKNASINGVTETTLLRSGLELSHAYEGITNGLKPEEDGILTSYEISQIDMSNVDMVTLSACETGLGDVTGDGVFGLQRGFKLAGAQSLLISLWKVDDYATQILMNRFYQGLLDGETKNEALLHAQQKVRSNKAYELPDYWAAFILLDGLN